MECWWRAAVVQLSSSWFSRLAQTCRGGMQTHKPVRVKRRTHRVHGWNGVCSGLKGWLVADLSFVLRSRWSGRRVGVNTTRSQS